MIEVMKSDSIDLIDLNCEVLILILLFLEVLNFNRILPFLVIHEGLQYFGPGDVTLGPCPTLDSAPLCLAHDSF